MPSCLGETLRREVIAVCACWTWHTPLGCNCQQNEHTADIMLSVGDIWSKDVRALAKAALLQNSCTVPYFEFARNKTAQRGLLLPPVLL